MSRVGIALGYLLVPFIALLAIGTCYGGFTLEEDVNPFLTILGRVSMFTISFCCIFTAGAFLWWSGKLGHRSFEVVAYVSAIVASLAAYAVYLGAFDGWRSTIEYLIMAGPYGLFAVVNLIRGFRRAGREQ